MAIRRARRRIIERRDARPLRAARAQEGLTLLEFEAGLELRVGRDKGGAVRAIMQEVDRGAPVTYLGDDLTDESAFLAVNQARGPHLSVLARRQRRKTAADVWLRPPAELRTFLRRWLDSRE